MTKPIPCSASKGRHDPQEKLQEEEGRKEVVEHLSMLATPYALGLGPTDW